jgi:hypothetical protein
MVTRRVKGLLEAGFEPTNFFLAAIDFAAAVGYACNKFAA